MLPSSLALCQPALCNSSTCEIERNRQTEDYANAYLPPKPSTNRTEGKLQDPYSAIMEANIKAGRTDDQPLPACVELTDSFDTCGNFVHREYFVQVQEDRPYLSCTVEGGWAPFDEVEFDLEIYLTGPDDDASEFYCYNSGPFVDALSCAIGGGPVVAVSIYYDGPSTTLSLYCDNAPCSDPVCGDGFCSNELETTLPLDEGVGAATDTSCKKDCGFFCPAVDVSLSLNPLETALYPIDM